MKEKKANNFITIDFVQLFFIDRFANTFHCIFLDICIVINS